VKPKTNLHMNKCFSIWCKRQYYY